MATQYGPKQTLTQAEQAGLKQFTDSVGRAAYVDPSSGAVYADKSNLSAGSVADWNQRQQNKAGSSPSTPAELTTKLDNYQSNLYKQYTAPEIKMPDIKIPTVQEVQAAVTPKTAMPDAINRVDTRAALTSEYGVADLEKTLNDLKSQEADAIAGYRQQTAGERGKPVATNVIAGRVGEAERVASERLDVITRQKNSVVDELNTKYAIINTYMQDKTLDYGDAVARYDKEFAQNMSIYSAITGMSQWATSTALDVQKTNISTAMQTAQLNESIKTRQESAARANLQIMVNAATNGNLNYGNMSNDQKLMITKLEMQGGLPVGTISSLQMSPKDSILFQNTNNGVTQVGIRGADGNITVKSYGTPTTPAAGYTTANLNTGISEMKKSLDAVAGVDHHVSPQNFTAAQQKWITAGFPSDKFYDTFSSYADPTHYWDYPGVSKDFAKNPNS